MFEMCLGRGSNWDMYRQCLIHQASMVAPIHVYIYILLEFACAYPCTMSSGSGCRSRPDVKSIRWDSLASPELVAKSDGQVDLSQVDLIGQSGFDRPKWTWSANVDLICQSGPGRPKWTWSAEVDLIGQSGRGRPKWTWSVKVDLVGQSGQGRPKWT